MKKFAIIFVILFSISCNDQTQRDAVVKPVLNLKNSEIYYVDKWETKDFYRYKEGVREKSENLLTFTFVNPSDKNLLFIRNGREYLSPIDKIEYTAFGFLGFRITDRDENVVKFAKPLVKFSRSDVDNDILNLIKEDSIKDVFYSKLGVQPIDIQYVENYIENSFILHPNESKTIKFSLSLPIIQEINGETWVTPLYYSDLKENQNFELIYTCNANELRKKLPKYLLEELDKNNTEIFDGVLKSNKVPLKLRQ